MTRSSSAPPVYRRCWPAMLPPRPMHSEKAVAVGGRNESSKVDLAVALALRSDTPQPDTARALNLLQEVLQQQPGSREALFNSALIAERMMLYDRALDYWQSFLKYENQSDWRRGAQQNMERVAQKKSFEQPRSSAAGFTAAEFERLPVARAAAIARGAAGRACAGLAGSRRRIARCAATCRYLVGSRSRFLARGRSG